VDPREYFKELTQSRAPQTCLGASPTWSHGGDALIERERPPMVIFQLDVVHNWPNKLPLNSMDEKSSPSVVQARVLPFISHKMALAALRGKKT
jgi:hypothetical protein